MISSVEVTHFVQLIHYYNVLALSVLVKSTSCTQIQACIHKSQHLVSEEEGRRTEVDQVWVAQEHDVRGMLREPDKDQDGHC